MQVTDAVSDRKLLDPREAALRKRKSIALTLLVAAGVVLAVARWLEHLHPHWGFALMAAMAEAALVGGLADWFAVVALFRHPLGQRWIPHTAIIPARKDAIGASLADFICDHFLGREQIIEKLDAFDVGQTLARKLADGDTSQAIGKAVTSALPRVLSALGSEQLHGFIHRATRERLQSVDVSGIAAFGLEQLTAGGRHHELVDSALGYISETLQSDATRELLTKRVGDEMWRVAKWVDLDATVANKLIVGVADFIEEMAQDRNHAMRLRLEQQLHELVGKLRNDPELRASIDRFRDQLMDQDVLADYLRSLWNDLVAWVERDVQQPDSVIAVRVAQASRAIGTQLLDDAATRAWINAGVKDTLEPLIDEHRETIRAFIVERIRKWSAEELTRELELSVGSDLQYIRYNGTAVGALIGGLIFAVVQLVAHLAP